MYIRYFVPEDGDEEKHPNVFRVNKDNNVTLADIKKAFPIPGSFHFRFLRSLESYVVWMDLVDDSAPAPIHNNCITIKASRLATVSNSAESRPQQMVRPAVAQRSAPVAPPAVQEEKKRQSVKLLNFDDGEIDTHSPKSAVLEVSPHGEADLLGFASAGSATAAANTLAPDPFGFGDLSAAPARTPSPMNPMAATPGISMGQSSPMARNPMGGGPMGGGPMGGGPMGGGPMGGGPMGGGPMGGRGMGVTMGGRGIGGPMGGSMPPPSQMNQQQHQNSNTRSKNTMGIDPFSGFK